MTKLLLKLKDKQNRTNMKLLKDSITNILDENGLKDRFTIWSYIDVLDNAQKVSKPTI